MQVTASLICKAVTIINVQITLCAAAAVQRDPEGERVFGHLGCAAAGTLLSGDDVTTTQEDRDALHVNIDLHSQHNLWRATIMSRMLSALPHRR